MDSVQFHLLPKAADTTVMREQLITKMLGLPVGEPVNLAHHHAGRPYLRGRPDWRCSFSDTTNWTAIALSHNRPVGIDIEEIQQVPAKIEKRARQLHTAEMAYPKDEPERSIALLSGWVLHEALIKACSESHSASEFLRTCQCAPDNRLAWGQSEAGTWEAELIPGLADKNLIGAIAIQQDHVE
ncbi:MAG: 4'-phosphopantetheinyl transferase superfamily protein [Actinomycetia bacterium]|nr:4'-phosphopantetheinyl transferase superfamily protein [Actinomycetes bacterium]